MKKLLRATRELEKNLDRVPTDDEISLESRIRKSCCDRRLTQAATMFLPAVGSEIYR
jgi:DNA-directed RNA polymerase specialized sigma subunit